MIRKCSYLFSKASVIVSWLVESRLFESVLVGFSVVKVSLEGASFVGASASLESSSEE